MILKGKGAKNFLFFDLKSTLNLRGLNERDMGSIKRHCR